MTAADTCRCGHDAADHPPLTIGSGTYTTTRHVCRHGDCRCDNYRPEVARG